MTDKASILADIVTIAEQAGVVIMEHYKAGTTVKMKEDRSPVTAADGAGEEIILAALARLTPNIPIVAEESVAAGRIPEVGDRPFWLVDPLDGTREFISKNGEFTVNIGLIEDKLPVMGVVLAPAIGRAWWGVVGQGATTRDADGERTIACRPVPDRGGTAVASRSHRDPDTNAWLEGRGVTDTVSAGSSLKFCRVAEAGADYYPRFAPTMEWDTAAGHAVLRAAGGEVTNTDGSPFLYTKPDFRNTGFIAWGRR